MTTTEDAPAGENAAIMDPTNPDAPENIVEQIKKIIMTTATHFLDTEALNWNSPTMTTANHRFIPGLRSEITAIFSQGNTREMAYEGMEGEGQANIVNLLRCAWAGSQIRRP